MPHQFVNEAKRELAGAIANARRVLEVAEAGLDDPESTTHDQVELAMKARDYMGAFLPFFDDAIESVTVFERPCGCYPGYFCAHPQCREAEGAVQVKE